MTALAELALLAETERLLAERRLNEAIVCSQEAEAAGAEADRCAAARWNAYMLTGQFESAWRESDAIFDRNAPDSGRFWRGESLVGKRIILRCLHGFGDATQFLRYVPRLRALASSLVIEVPPRFINLARCFDGVEKVITWGAAAPIVPPAWDVQVEVMELPYIFRTRLDELPLATRYLRLPPAPPLQALHHGALRVGLAWNAGSWNQARSLDLAALAPILAVEGCEFWSLEGGPDCLRSAAPPTSVMRSHALCAETIQGLAATISQLDLIITVDTLVAHLAGALGINAWVLLQYEADWRWMHDRSDSSWYPSLKLLRQPLPGQWKRVIAAVTHALQAEVRVRNGCSGYA